MKTTKDSVCDGVWLSVPVNVRFATGDGAFDEALGGGSSSTIRGPRARRGFPIRCL